jgi:hypothetical protein
VAYDQQLAAELDHRADPDAEIEIEIALAPALRIRRFAGVASTIVHGD